MRIFPIVRRVVNVISGGTANWLARVRAGTRTSVVTSLRAALQRPATRVSQAPSALVGARQAPASGVTAIVQAAASVLQRPASRASLAPATLLAARPKAASRVAMAPPTLIGAKPRSGGNIVQLTDDMTHASHVVTAAQDVGGTGTWANPTRMQGVPNDPGDHTGDSDIGGQALVAVTGLLRGTMVAQPNRPASLAIQEVWLDWYGQVSGLPVVDDLISRLELGYRINISPVPSPDAPRVTINTGNDNFHNSPKTARIDDGAGFFAGSIGLPPVTWANVALIQPYFRAVITLGLTGAHYYADSVRLRVVASDTFIN